MQKQKVTIRFSSLTKLWDFRMAIDASVFEMNLHMLTITCECTKKHIELAINQYKATLVDPVNEGQQMRQ